MTIRIIQGDCREMLATLPDASVHCCVTSPPYWGLRDYGVAGQLGLETSPDAYAAEMVEVFREVRRVLRDDGTLWLNLGDSYNSIGHKKSNSGYGTTGLAGGIAQEHTPLRRENSAPGLKHKDLVGVPWMVAFALRADGWYLRSDIIWATKNCMPESVTDRPSQAHEHVFLLTKQQRYFYDAEAIREEGVIPAGTRAAKGSSVRSELKDVNGRPPEYWDYTGTRNSRNVWSIATRPFADAHFATFPPELAERCISAGTSERGCCSACGTQWIRQTERTGNSNPSFKGSAFNSGKTGARDGGDRTQAGARFTKASAGWAPGCGCDATVRSCTVLDPFAGAFTTAMVADRLQRNAIGIELNPEYCAMAERRLTNDAGLFAQIAPE